MSMKIKGTKRNEKNVSTYSKLLLFIRNENIKTKLMYFK